MGGTHWIYELFINDHTVAVVGGFLAGIALAFAAIALHIACAVYSHFDIIWDHLTEMSGLFATPHTPCTVLYVVTMLIGC